MFRTQILTAACTMLFLSSGAFFAPGNAATNSSYMKSCSTQWQGMKQAGTVPAGMKWTGFLKTCSSSSTATQASAPQTQINSQPAPSKKVGKTATLAPASNVPVVAPATNGSAPTAQLAEQTRIKECGTEWKSAKAANTVPVGQTWPQFWSACDARLKATHG